MPKRGQAAEGSLDDAEMQLQTWASPVRRRRSDDRSEQPRVATRAESTGKRKTRRTSTRVEPNLSRAGFLLLLFVGLGGLAAWSSTGDCLAEKSGNDELPGAEGLGTRALNKRRTTATSSNNYNEIDPRGQALGAKKEQQHLSLEPRPQQQAPGELLFSNQTGAVVQCGVALDLAKSIVRAERVRADSPAPSAPTSNQSSGQSGGDFSFGGSSSQRLLLSGASLLQRAGIEVRWEKENGEELEQSLYTSAGGGVGPVEQQQRPLRFVRPLDGALVFEPFRASELRPDVHAATYRCVASSASRGASVLSRDLRVRAALVGGGGGQTGSGHQQQPSLEVPDELAIEGNNAVFKCQVPNYAQEYLQLVDWIEYPSETVLSFQSTTLANAAHLFPLNQQQSNLHGRQQQQQQPQGSNRTTTLGRYFVAPKSGDLHILNADSSLNYRSYKCRCRNRLTGELVSSSNRGKLIVTESHSPMAPRLLASEAQQQQHLQMFGAGAAMAPLNSAGVYEEGELAMLACNLQAFPRAQVNWFRRLGELDTEPIESLLATVDNKYALMSGLLLINRVNRNDSGTYLCQVRNSVGEERLEMELPVRGPLKAKLSASASVLELGKSLALECSVSGYPIHQVIFRHNQNVIKSISGNVNTQTSHDHRQHSASFRHLSQQQHFGGRRKAASDGSYFVVDSSSSANVGEQVVGEQPTAATNANNVAAAAGASSPTTNNSDDDEPDEKDDENSREEENQVKLSHVIVIVLEPQHAGAYQCFAYNQYESVQSSAYIRVLDDPPKFKETFRSEVFEQRQDISLQCSARANPLPEITWSIDEQPIPESSRIRFGDFVTKDNLVISYVNISQTQVTDSGQYRCTADNGLAQVSHQAQISVSGPLQVKPMPNVTVVASTSFRIRCPVAGYPVSEVQWQHNGRRLPSNHRQHVYDNGTLEVEHMEKSQADEGEYTCIASGQVPNPAGGSGGANSRGQQRTESYGSVHISIKVRPTIEPFSISRSLREGQRASVMCTISSGDLPISISWFRNEQPLVPIAALSARHDQLGETSGSGDSSAMVALGSAPQVSTAGYSGGYSGTFGGGGDSQQSEQQQALGGAFNQQQQLFNQSAQAGLLAGVRISRVSDYSSTLLFESLLVEHSGNYTCLARNDAGSASHQAPMVVQVAPKWSLEPSDTNVVRGSSMSIDCMASGFPPPRIIWTKAAAETMLAGQASSSLSSLASQVGPTATTTSMTTSSATGGFNSMGKSHHLGSWRSIVSSPHLQVYENGSLNILDARDSDFGHYMCQATNGVGPGLSKVIKVTINVAAQFSTRHSVQYVAKGDQAHLKCQAKGDWPMAIHWLKNRNRLEPVNVQEQQQTAAATATNNNNIGQLLSASSASLLLAPGGANNFMVSGQAPVAQPAHKVKGSALEQLNGQLLSSGQQQQQQSNSVSGGGLLMQRYSLTNSEIALNARGDQQSGSSLEVAASGAMQRPAPPTSPPAANSAGSVQQQAAAQAQLYNSYENGKQQQPTLVNHLHHHHHHYHQQQPLIIQLNSMLSISQVERQDTGTFKCLAANQFGFDERTIQLIVQEVPDKIEELSVLEVNSRSITLGWLAPYDGNSPITSFHIQYKQSSSPGSASAAAAPVLPSSNSSPGPLPGSSSSPPSASSMFASRMMSSDTANGLNWFNYTLTASAGNSGVVGNANDDLTSALPEAASKQQPPAAASGLATISSGQQRQQQLQLQTGANGVQLAEAATQSIAAGAGAGGGAKLGLSPAPYGGRSLVKVTISSLWPVTHYWFRVGAENKLGHGQMSNLIESITMEEAPGAAPNKLKAVAQSSSSILVSWSRMSDKDVFGSVHGYYVAYKPLLSAAQQQRETSASGAGNPSKSQLADSASNSQQQHGLDQQPATNIYKTIPHDDKLSKFDALLTGLKRSTKYVISVQAFNARGTGPATEPVVVRTLEMDPPKQVRLYVRQASNCSIQLEWRPMSQAALIQQQLLQKKPQANATSPQLATTASAGAADQKSPLPPLATPSMMSGRVDSGDAQQPHQPLVSGGGSEQLLEGRAEGGSPAAGGAELVEYYSLYQAELNERPMWQEVRLPGHASSYTIDNLRCGTRYQFYMMGVNKIGVGDQSDILDTKTAGGLPLAPDRQSTFDVVNTTCYIIRLDHWQDNGCPIREFNVRFRQDSARDWTQLAHFNLLPPEDPINSRRDSAASSSGGSTATIADPALQTSTSDETGSGRKLRTVEGADGGTHRGFLDELWVGSSSSLSSPSQRLKRDPLSSLGLAAASAAATAAEAEQQIDNNLQLQQQKFATSLDKSNVYVLPVDDGRDDEDSFLDYSADSESSDYVSELPMHQEQQSTLASKAGAANPNGNGSSLPIFSAITDTSGEPTAQSNSQLFSLLKDSMLPTFSEDSSDLSQTSSSSSRLERSQMTAVAQEWRTSNFVESSETKSTTKTSRASAGDQDQQAGGGRAGQVARGRDSVASSMAEWRRIRLCNLAENVYYSIQVTALNSVGETEAELRVLTSQEGLEYDQEIKRQVVGKLGGDRMAQSIAMSDRLGGLFALNQWPVLVPITLTIILMTIIVFVTLLLKRSHPAGSTSTTTTTTTTMGSSASSHCQNYLNESHAGHHGGGASLFKGGYGGGSSGGAPSAITEAATLGTDMHGGGYLSHLANGGGPNGTSSGANLDATRYALTAPGGMIDNYGQNGNMSSIYQHHHRSSQSVFEEPAYGVVGMPSQQQQQLLLNAPNGLQGDETNRSSGSPATTTANTTSLHSGGSSGGGQNLNPHHAMCMRHPGASDQQQQEPLEAARARNVYLYAAGSPVKSETIFYGMAPNSGGRAAQIYAGNPQAIQVRHYQQPDENSQHLLNANGNEKQQQDHQYPLYEGNQMQQQQQLDLATENHQNRSKNIVDNCFMSIVEEVARANDSLLGQQRSNTNVSAANLGGGGGLNSPMVPSKLPMGNHQMLADQGGDQSCHSCNNPLDCFHQQLNQQQQQQQQGISNYVPAMIPNNNNSSSHEHDDSQSLKNSFADHQQQANSQHQAAVANRLMLDPVYATIRRTFPQAFRYLTLQQQHHHHNSNGNQQQQQLRVQQQQRVNQNQQQQQQPQGQLICDQRHSLNEDLSSVVLNQFIDNQQRQQQVVHDMAMFNSNNLAALNLLTPTTTTLIQQNQQQQ